MSDESQCQEESEPRKSLLRWFLNKASDEVGSDSHWYRGGAFREVETESPWFLRQEHVPCVWRRAQRPPWLAKIGHVTNKSLQGRRGDSVFHRKRDELGVKGGVLRAAIYFSLPSERVGLHRCAAQTWLHSSEHPVTDRMARASPQRPRLSQSRAPAPLEVLLLR